MREKLLIFFVFLFANVAPIYAYDTIPNYTDNVRDFNYYSANQNYQADADTSNSYPKVTKIEALIFKQTFVNEDIEKRLARIENKMFRKTNSDMSLAERVDLISNNIDPGVFYDISNEKLSYIENKIFGRQYPNDDTETRIIRLEKEMLGAMQDGNLKERFDVVAQASKHYTSFPSLQEDNYNTAQQPYNRNYQNYQQYSNTPYTTYSNSNTNQRGVKNTLGNIVSGLLGVGTMTGFTPPIYPSQYSNGYQYYNPTNNYYDPYTNQGIQDNRSTQTPYGYYNHNRSYGTSGGVKVLYD